MAGINLTLQLHYADLKAQIQTKSKKFYTLKDNPYMKQDIMYEYANYSSVYVPFDTGALVSTFGVNRNGALTYYPVSPHNKYHYADKVYEGLYYPRLKTPTKDGRQYFKRQRKMRFSQAVHPKATDHWNVAFEAGPEFKHFLRAAKAICVKYYARAIKKVSKADFIAYMMKGR